MCRPRTTTTWGDSILGYRSHMGAGSITSNVKSDKSLVVVHGQGENMETGLKKFGAMLGDFVEVGCNSVLNPGTVIGRESNVYPLSCVRGVVPARHIYKDRRRGRAQALKIFRLTGGAANAIVSVLRMTRDAPW